MKDRESFVIGLDIGSLSISVAQLSLTGQLIKHNIVYHKGNIHNALVKLNSEFDLSSISGVACTGALIYNKDKITIIDPQVALIEAVKNKNPDALSILQVGAEKFFLIKFNKNGKYESTVINPSCAAGTGSFLDQQAIRLNLSGSAELADRALKNTGPVPGIASRCAVFAKTDLIHAQQKGYSLEAICDSLCEGLAENIFDALFNKEDPLSPMIFLGGVSKNKAVVKHLEPILGLEPIVPENPDIYGAVGAALNFLKYKTPVKQQAISSLEEIIEEASQSKHFFHKALKLEKSIYPDFISENAYIFTPKNSGHLVDVQCDHYKELEPGMDIQLSMGIDIGSTSTKAVLINSKFEPFLGFYTYTAGKPISAVKAILEAIWAINKSLGNNLKIGGCGTTGSGRKFAGKVIGADCIIDEITAHARAAYHLNPNTDTIIEIGGQDAKFTSMDNGTVTFSQMNTVCAAGTGSFLEEQAKKLGTSLLDYEERAMNVSAPMASDRCTVFMERDINQLLNAGYTVEQLLATSLHSVAENYIQKVASEARIGNNVCFQGATAKNKALIAAFEQRLKKKIFVSRFCHLTGAVGAAIMTIEEQKGESSFKGLKLFEEHISLENEICTLCSNKCHISVANVMGEKVAYGFMCGRDYDTDKYVNKNTSGFNLLEERKKLLKIKAPGKYKHEITIGLPSSLHLFEDIGFWKTFWRTLSIRTISSEGYKDSLAEGKRRAGAEFCAPIDSMYGHASWLAEKADYVFLPVILESKSKPKLHVDRNYCYYSQFSPALIHSIRNTDIHKILISPQLNYFKGKLHIIKAIRNELKKITGISLGLAELEAAYNIALQSNHVKQGKLNHLYEATYDPANDLSVVLMGRPYVVLSKVLNKGIPDIFSGMGIKAYFQDMLPKNDHPSAELEILLKKVPWHFAAEILETAKMVAETKGLYPVLITAFRCAPDSFIIEYFKKIFNTHKKPYLILQIDEHDSNIGYETRVESALRAFRNHSRRKKQEPVPESFHLLPSVEKEIKNKTLLFPNWDPMVSPLLVANLKRSGIDSRLLESNELTIAKSMGHNTGQCLPLNIIAQEYIEFIQKHNLNPAKSLLWLMETHLSCNIRMYPFFIKTILENQGNGFEKAGIYSGDLSHKEISLKTTYWGYFAYMAGGLLRKLICKTRPYETVQGITDDIASKSMEILKEVFLGERPLDKSIMQITADFKNIPQKEGNKPKVALFGDFYVRDNDIMNQGLIKAIEEAGGEVLTTPYTEYVKITQRNYVRRAIERGDYLGPAMARPMMAAVTTFEERYYKYFDKILGPQPVVEAKELESNLKKFNIALNQSGESYDNLLKVFYIKHNYPDVKLFIQTSPAYCCPSLVTEAMTHEITRLTGVPVVTINYDGTNDYKNDVIVPYLKYAVEG